MMMMMMMIVRHIIYAHQFHTFQNVPHIKHLINYNPSRVKEINLVNFGTLTKNIGAHVDPPTINTVRAV